MSNEEKKLEPAPSNDTLPDGITQIPTKDQFELTDTEKALIWVLGKPVQGMVPATESDALCSKCNQWHPTSVQCTRPTPASEEKPTMQGMSVWKCPKCGEKIPTAIGKEPKHTCKSDVVKEAEAWQLLDAIYGPEGFMHTKIDAPNSYAALAKEIAEEGDESIWGHGYVLGAIIDLDGVPYITQIITGGDASLKYFHSLIARCGELERGESQLIQERDQRENQLQDIDIALGGDGEWSNVRDCGVEALTNATDLQAENKELAEQAKELEKKTEPLPESMRGSFFNACTDPCDMLHGPCACGAWHTATEWAIKLSVQLKALAEQVAELRNPKVKVHIDMPES